MAVITILAMILVGLILVAALAVELLKYALIAAVMIVGIRLAIAAGEKIIEKISGKDKSKEDELDITFQDKGKEDELNNDIQVEAEKFDKLVHSEKNEEKNKNNSKLFSEESRDGQHSKNRNFDD